MLGGLEVQGAPVRAHDVFFARTDDEVGTAHDDFYVGGFDVGQVDVQGEKIAVFSDFVVRAAVIGRHFGHAVAQNWTDGVGGGGHGKKDRMVGWNESRRPRGRPDRKGTTKLEDGPARGESTLSLSAESAPVSERATRFSHALAATRDKTGRGVECRGGQLMSVGQSWHVDGVTMHNAGGVPS